MLPSLFAERMKNMLGKEYEEFEKSYNEDSFQALRFNPLKGELSTFLDRTEFQLTPVPWSENGFYFQKEDCPGKHPYHEAGVYYIQEPSAQLPAELLQAEPGENILDLCSAPGGKATQIAGGMKGQGLLVCNEYVPSRAKILSENIERMGIRNALVLNETPEHLKNIFPGFFHRILVDAPCSGEGMFRKNEEACKEWSPENVKMCAERQDGILDAAAVMLMPGGRLVYSTCTFSEEEDEGSVQRFIKRHPDFKIKEQHRLWPHKIKGEGHFAAVLEKTGTAFPNPVPRSGFEKGISIKGEKEFLTFVKETVKTVPSEEEGVFVKFGNQLYLLPEGTPSLKGMKVLRPGLHLGTFLKNRFEPSHALALSLRKEEVLRSFELETVERARQYLAGNIFDADTEKGWYLITIDGYSLGWGKLAGGKMKNHYPKGLRK